MSVYTHPNKPGWQMIKIFHGKDKPEYIPYPGTPEQAKIYELELRGIIDRSDPVFTDRLPEFKIAYKNEVMESTYTDFTWALKQLLPFFQNMKIRHITPQIIEEYKRIRQDMTTKNTNTPISKRTINRELSYLSKYLQYCEHKIKPVKFRKKDCQPDTPQVLSIKELIALIENTKPPIKYLVQLMAFNGLRKQEAFNLQSKDANIEGTQLRIWGKGGKWRTAPISLPELQQAIAAAKKEQPEGYLFPNPKTNKPYNDIRKTLVPAAIKAGIDQHIYNHLLRHSFATSLVSADVNLTVIQNLMGHADINMTQKYIHLADETMRQGTEKLAKTATEQTQ